MTIKEKCVAHGISYQTYHDRLKRGWTEEEAIGEKVREHKQGIRFEAFGQKKTLKEWSAQVGLSYKCLYQRLQRGMSLEAAIKCGTVRPFPHTTTYKGETMTIHHLAKVTGMSYSLLVYRVEKMGLTGDEAVARPVRRGGYRGRKQKNNDTKRTCSHDNCFTCPYEDCIA